MIANYRTAWRFLVKNPMFFVGISILLLTLHEFRQYLPESGSVVVLVLWMAFYQILKRLLALFDKRIVQEKSDAFSNYCVASTVVAVVAFIAITAYYRYLFNDYETGDYGRAQFYFIVNWIYPFVFGLCGAFGGTAVVAAVMNDFFGVRTTFERAKRTWDFALIGMITGPGIFGVVAFVAVYMLVDTSSYEGSAEKAILLLHRYLLGCVGLFAMILAGSVMLHAYMLVAPEHIRRRMHMGPIPRGMADRWKQRSQPQTARPHVLAYEFGAGLGMLGIYNETWSFLRQNYLVIGVFAAALFVFDLISLVLHVNPFLTSLPALLVIYGLMRMFMFDDRDWDKISQQRPDGFGKFLIVTTLMITAIGTLALIGMVQVFGPSPQDMEDGTIYVLAASAMCAGALLLVGAAAGTALPAAVAGDKCGLSLSYKRAVGTWWRLPLGLLYGPIMSGIVTALVFGLILSALGGTSDVASSDLHPLKLIGNFVFQFVFLYHVVLAIAAFTIAYQHIAPAHIKAAMGREVI